MVRNLVALLLLAAPAWAGWSAPVPFDTGHLAHNEVAQLAGAPPPGATRVRVTVNAGSHLRGYWAENKGSTTVTWSQTYHAELRFLTAAGEFGRYGSTCGESNGLLPGWWTNSTITWGIGAVAQFTGPAKPVRALCRTRETFAWTASNPRAAWWPGAHTFRLAGTVEWYVP